jgi:hypothetical protein
MVTAAVTQPIMMGARLLLLLLLGLAPSAPAPACRDRLKQPFSSTSIWNTAIGSEAVFVPANIFAPVPQPAGKDQCALGKAKPAWRETCRGFQPSWTEEDCLRHDCCYDPTPECAAPPPEGRVACGSGPGRGHGHQPYTPTNGCTAALGCCYSPVPGSTVDWCIPMNQSANGTHCGVCGTPLPPKSMGSRQCYTKESTQFSNASDWQGDAAHFPNSLPGNFYVDTDYFIVTKPSDPLVPFYDQGWWGGPAPALDPEGMNPCARQNSTVPGHGGDFVGMIPFPHDFVVPGMTSNNVAAVLLPDNETLVQFAPIIRCTPGGPVHGLKPSGWLPNGGTTHCGKRALELIRKNGKGKGCAGNVRGLINVTKGNRTGQELCGCSLLLLPRPDYPTTNASILGEGEWGAHGSRISSLGGAIRQGELLPDAPPIPHAIKLMLWGAAYYWPGTDNFTSVCYRWPALNCDQWSIPSVHPYSYPSNANYYGGKIPGLSVGTLLAVPGDISASIAPRIRTVLGKKILQVLTDYGGYPDDDTASNSAAYNVEAAVHAEVEAAYGIQLRLNSSDTTTSALGGGPGDPYYSDLLAIYQGLHIVDNNGPDSIGGGGVPRRPPAPPICDAPVSGGYRCVNNWCVHAGDGEVGIELTACQQVCGREQAEL